MNEYYLKILEKIHGPLSQQEVTEMIKEGALPLDGLVSQVGQQEWRLPKDLPEFAVAYQRPVSSTSSTAITESQVAQEEDGELEEAPEEKGTKYQHISAIRKSLDELAERQIESIIAKIRNHDSNTAFTQARGKELRQAIESSAIEYWRRSGLLSKWIAEFVRINKKGKRADHKRKLKGEPPEKYDDVQNWLEKLGYHEEEGCYCFMKGNGYKYIGQTTKKTLQRRIKDHEDKIWWADADAFRVVIPQYKTQCEALERLLILNYQPTENETFGNRGQNPADNILEFIRKEVKELARDRKV
ncbi:MAG: hypothetical protein A2V83_06365 [Nitrospirae bacterium RBG_16_64_22]|nr:MAG: hypothetical protein A2V83_06365 [Nitrospirae bacterium RBG_16_64_22]